MIESMDILSKFNTSKAVIGVDLGDITSQISYGYLGQEVPETVSLVAGGEQYNIPTLLCKREDVNQWFYGREALKKKDEGTLVTNLLTHAKEGTLIAIEETQFEPMELLILYVKKLFSLLSTVIGTDKYAAVIFTLDVLDNKMIEILDLLTASLNLKTDQVSYQSHEESFFSYMLHQDKILWSNQVIVCDASAGFIKTLRMEINRKTSPQIALIEKEVYPDIKLTMIPEKKEEQDSLYKLMDGTIAAMLIKLCGDKNITAAYLIGDAFTGEWYRQTLRFLCKGRRVFQGNNMYSKGACYSGMDKLTDALITKEYVFLGKDKLKANVGMRVYKKGEEGYFALLDAGHNWYEAKKEFDLILDSGNQLDILATPLNGKEPIVATIPWR
ncbi:MAG: hypothetical protein HGA25_11740, partial [Clostridiales bacterium]|nr:hypothetical protein [Clostridiales bacterium]